MNRLETRRAALIVLAGLLLATSARTAVAQIPDEFTNLKVYPEDISRDELIGNMRNFTFALGVRCQHCHYSETGSFRDVDFASDELPEKETARDMIRMLRKLNTEILPAVANRKDPPVEMTCKTCHRGRTRPILLSQELVMATHESGVHEALRLYEQYREDTYGRGMFDFGEFETNVAGEQLTDEGRFEDAIAIYEKNLEYHPESLSVLTALGELYEQVGRTDDAISAWEHVLEIRPGHRQATEHLSDLKDE
jgi:tetratricopeptide (TPR) repeat protein